MTTTLLRRLTAALGDGAVLTDPEDLARYVTDWTGVLRGSTTAVVPQGGSTGLAGGATPDAA